MALESKLEISDTKWSFHIKTSASSACRYLLNEPWDCRAETLFTGYLHRECKKKNQLLSYEYEINSLHSIIVKNKI